MVRARPGAAQRIRMPPLLEGNAERAVQAAELEGIPAKVLRSPALKAAWPPS